MIIGDAFLEPKGSHISVSAQALMRASGGRKGLF